MFPRKELNDVSRQNRDDVTMEQAMNSKLLYGMHNKQILIVTKFQTRGVSSLVDISKETLRWRIPLPGLIGLTLRLPGGSSRPPKVFLP